MTNASSASGSPGHVGAELFKSMAGIEAVHVPYRGGVAATTDLIAGRVTFMFESLNSIAPHAKSGAVRGLAVSGDRRSPAFPDVPTVAEAGVPGYSAPTWSGVIAPAGTPKAIIDRINAAVNKAIRTEAFKDRFGAIGDEPAGGPPEEFAKTIRTDLAKWRDVVQRSGAKLELSGAKTAASELRMARRPSVAVSDFVAAIRRQRFHRPAARNDDLTLPSLVHEQASAHALRFRHIVRASARGSTYSMTGPLYGWLYCGGGSRTKIIAWPPKKSGRQFRGRDVAAALRRRVAEQR